MRSDMPASRASARACRHRRRPARGSSRARHPLAAARGAAHRRPHRPRARWPRRFLWDEEVHDPSLRGIQPASAVTPGRAAREPVPEHPVAPTRVAATGHPTSMAPGERRRRGPAVRATSGGRGIRTHERLAPLAVFKTAALGHYAEPSWPGVPGPGQGVCRGGCARCTSPPKARGRGAGARIRERYHLHPGEVRASRGAGARIRERYHLHPGEVRCESRCRCTDPRAVSPPPGGSDAVVTERHPAGAGG